MPIAIIVIIIQAIVELILWWIKNRIKPEDQPAALKDFEIAYAAAKAQRSAEPLRALWRRLKGA